MAPSLLEEVSGVADGTEADPMGLRIKVFGYKLSEKERAGLRVLGGLDREIKVSDSAVPLR